jgi:hypothetical protein
MFLDTGLICLYYITYPLTLNLYFIPYKYWPMDSVFKALSQSLDIFVISHNLTYVLRAKSNATIVPATTGIR